MPERNIHYDVRLDAVVQWCWYCEEEAEFYHQAVGHPDDENSVVRCRKCDGVIWES